VDVVLLFPPTANPAPSYFGPPYGLALLGALLEQAGHRVTAYDYDRRSVTDMLADLERVVREDKPQLVGISCLSVNRGPGEIAARKMRALGPDVPIVFGGPFPTLEPELTLRRTPADFVCIGDGDETLLDLVDALETGRSIATVPGLAHRVEGQIRRTEERPRFTALDTLPFPKLDLFPIHDMIEQHRLDEQRAQMSRIDMNGRLPFVTDALIMVMGSRGCAWECSFCPLSKWEGRTLFHSPEYIVRQIEEYKRQFGWRTFVFGDNTLTYPQHQIMEICDLMVERNVDVEWICMTRADMVNRDVLDRMGRAGCREISYGIESLSQSVQKAIKKKLSVKRVPPAFELTHQAGVTSCIMLMVGNQGESRETMRESAGLAREIQPDRILINTTKVYPGTYLWDAAVKDGLVGPDYFERDVDENPFDLAPDYTGEVGEAELRELERMLRYRTTYVPVAKLSREALEERLLMSAWRGEHAVLGDGDPVQHPDLPALIAFSREHEVHHFAVVSDARALGATRRRALLAAGLERLIVPIFAIHDAHHDGRVGTPGALRETRKGLLGWTREGGKASAWAFIDRWNVGSLERWPEWLKEHGVGEVLFVYGESPPGWQGVPFEDLPSLVEAGRALQRTLVTAREAGIEMSVAGLPACVLGGDEAGIEIHELGRPFDELLGEAGKPALMARARTREKSYLEICERCRYRASCEGIWNRYLELHGAKELEPEHPAEDGRRRLAMIGG
jgi:radical SAM superfamily enzyme YgiQ (UPF0313 family)